MKKWTEIPFVGLIAGQVCIVAMVLGFPVPSAMAFLDGLDWPLAITLSLFSLHIASISGQIAHNETWKPQGWNAVFFASLLVADCWYTSYLLRSGEWYYAALMCLTICISGHVTVAMLVEKFSAQATTQANLKLASSVVPSTTTELPCDDVIAV